MKKHSLCLVLILLFCCVNVLAQQGKSKSLTMDDVSPTPKADTVDDSPTPKTSKKKKTANKAEDPLEKSWQSKINETELKFLTAQLHSELNNRSQDTVIELNRQKQYMEELISEGNKKGYEAERSLDVIYRERYVKLRLQMIDEARINPSSSETQLLYIDSKKNRKRKTKTLKGQNIPTLDTKAVKTHQTKMDKLEAKLDDLEEEGRRAGVSARIFED